MSREILLKKIKVAAKDNTRQNKVVYWQYRSESFQFISFTLLIVEKNRYTYLYMTVSVVY